MTTQPLEQAITSTRTVLKAVSKEQLGDSTPCAAWKVSATKRSVTPRRATGALFPPRGNSRQHGGWRYTGEHSAVLE